MKPTPSQQPQTLRTDSLSTQYPDQILTIGSTGRDSTPTLRAVPERHDLRHEPAPIVQLPVGSVRSLERPVVVAKADLQVKRFRGHRAAVDRYEVVFHAHSETPAALLAALADAVEELEEFAGGDAPGDHLIMNVTIRR